MPLQKDQPNQSIAEARPSPKQARNRKDPADRGQIGRVWKENHGNALMGFAVVILILGMLVIRLSPSPIAPPEIDVAENQNRPGNPGSELPQDSILLRVVTDHDSQYKDSPIRIAIYDSEDAFGDPERAVIKDSMLPKDGFAVWAIKLDFLPEEFSVAAYHDLDNNGQLNRALFNAPVEPYGFSNNARSRVGPPTFEQTLMKRPQRPASIEVRVY